MQTFRYMRQKKVEGLLDFLCRRFRYLDKEGWRASIAQGELRVNDRCVSPEYILQSRDCISYLRPKASEPEIDRRFRILWEDEALVVVEKNANIPVAESGKYRQNTLITVMREDGCYGDLYPVHRLDRETSGVIALAKTLESTRILGEAFCAGTPQKRYHTIVLGQMQEMQEVDAPIKKNDSGGGIRIRQVIHQSGKPARTRFTPLAHITPKEHGARITLCEVETFSGRTHQIRCHAAHLGYPILGDKLYGQSDEDFLQYIKREKLPRHPLYGEIPRQLLHATSLSFLHPSTGELLCFESPSKPFFTQISAHFAPLYTP